MTPQPVAPQPVAVVPFPPALPCGALAPGALTILALKWPWLSSPTKVSLLGSDLRSRCFRIPSTASR